MPSELQSIPSSPLMISTVPPPRPVSVNSLARTPASSVIPLKMGRSTSAAIPGHDEPSSSSTPASVSTQLDSETESQAETPFESRSSVDTEMEDVSTNSDETMDAEDATDPAEQSNSEEAQKHYSPELQFESLPIEIHDAILDHLFGERVSTSANIDRSSVHNWTNLLRHPRRRELTDLALISPIWRRLVQERIYRHIKIKGTTDELAKVAEWFRERPYLAPHIRHIEIWVPVWGTRVNRTILPHQPPQNDNNNVRLVAVVPQQAAMADDAETNQTSNASYYYSSRNATLEEIFHHVSTFFSEARVLTLEGGHCKNPPMIRQFKNGPSGLCGERQLELLPNVQTFVMRGSWNIMRDIQHWCNMSRALPALREWHCSYAEPTKEAYDTVSRIFTRPPTLLSHANISLEGFCHKESPRSSPSSDGPKETHLCRSMGEVLPYLESLTFTGRICTCFFNHARASAMKLRGESKLKSLDLTVNMVCRENWANPGLSGITNMHFILAFENLILSAVRALEYLPALESIRIRYIDLESPCQHLNPYFHLIKKRCYGLWSVDIIETLTEIRPDTYFAELADGIYPQYGPNGQIIGAVYPRARPQSIQACNYKIIADASKA